MEDKEAEFIVNSFIGDVFHTQMEIYNNKYKLQNKSWNNP